MEKFYRNTQAIKLKKNVVLREQCEEILTLFLKTPHVCGVLSGKARNTFRSFSPADVFADGAECSGMARQELFYLDFMSVEFLDILV